MPFTLAHPGFSLILKHKKFYFLDIIGLTVGSIVPDLDILFRLSNSRMHLFTYDIQEIIFVILPMAMLLTIYFHVLSAKLNRRTLIFDFKNLLFIALSCCLGIVLHLILDRYTHLDAANMVIALDQKTDYTYAQYNQLYYLLRYGPLTLASLLGFAFIYIFYRKNPSALFNFSSFSLDKNKLLICASGLFVVFFSLKMLITGIESSFIIDSLAIVFTAAFVAVCCTLPLLVLIFRKHFHQL